MGESSKSRNSPAELAPEEFRSIGHSLVDSVANFLSTLRTAPTASPLSPNAIRELLGTRAMPQDGGDVAAVMKDFSEKFFAHSTHNGSPRFFGYITSSAAPVGALADLLAAAVNPNVGAWALSPLATEVERETIRWIAEFLGLTPEWDGLLVSGGNMANLVGFVAAKTAKADWNIRESGLRSAEARNLVVYASSETHTWLNKATDISGLGTNAIRWVPVDADLRISVDALQNMIGEDIQAGLTPFMVVGTAGSVSTGAIDPLKEVAEVCSRFGLWLHVDGAYGAPAAGLANPPAGLESLGYADSIAVDPHKWLYSSLEAGCILTRHPDALRNAFSFAPPYYQFDDHDGEAVTNYFESGPQNSRGFRALKIWLAFQQVGANGFRQMIGDDIALAKKLHDLVGGSECLEQGTNSLSITTFRYVPIDLSTKREEKDVAEYLNELNARIVTAIRVGGRAFLSNAVVDHKFMLRACIVNFRTTEGDVASLPPLVESVGKKVDVELREGRK